MFYYLGILLQPQVVEMGTSIPGLIDFRQAWGSHLSALLPYTGSQDSNTTPAVIQTPLMPRPEDYGPYTTPRAMPSPKGNLT